MNTDNRQKKQVIILLGAPGSGKGTQAAKLSKALQLPHISTGDLFRDNIRNKTELGQRVQGYLDAGKLVPDETVLNMVFDRVSKADCLKGFLLDGFPRTIGQAEALVEKLKQDSSLLVVNIDVKDEVVVKRIAGRVSCKQCGEIYNIYFTPPKTEGICDACGGGLYHRSDDNEEVIQKRLAVYHKQTKPLIGYFQNLNALVDIDGEQEPQKVYEDLQEEGRRKKKNKDEG